jgi:hypothetical protein
MIQCLFCQDWYHDFCIKKEYEPDLPTDEDGTEYICRDCTKKYRFFLTKYPGLQYTPAKAESDQVGILPDPTVSTGDVALTPTCHVEGVEEGPVKDLFMVAGWKDQICRCKRCLATYTYAGVPWLVEEKKDPIEEVEHPYAEETGEAPAPKLDFVQQMEVHHGMNTLKDKLSTFLQTLVRDSPDRVIEKRVSRTLLLPYSCRT